MAGITNEEFGKRVGCHYSMASRLRHGERMPSLALLTRIVNEFGLNQEEAWTAVNQGPEAFSAFLRAKVFDPVESPPDRPSE